MASDYFSISINNYKISSYDKVINWVYVYFIYNNLLFYFSQQK